MLDNLLMLTQHFDLLRVNQIHLLSSLCNAIANDDKNPYPTLEDYNNDDTVIELPEPIRTNKCFRHHQDAITKMLVESYANVVLRDLKANLNALSTHDIGNIIIEDNEFTFEFIDDWNEGFNGRRWILTGILNDYKNTLFLFSDVEQLSKLAQL